MFDISDACEAVSEFCSSQDGTSLPLIETNCHDRSILLSIRAEVKAKRRCSCVSSCLREAACLSSFEAKTWEREWVNLMLRVSDGPGAATGAVSQMEMW
eukprot:494614-Prorocentrum_minimum.AAC.1